MGGLLAISLRPHLTSPPDLSLALLLFILPQIFQLFAATGALFIGEVNGSNHVRSDAVFDFVSSSCDVERDRDRPNSLLLPPLVCHQRYLLPPPSLTFPLQPSQFPLDSFSCHSSFQIILMVSQSALLSPSPICPSENLPQVSCQGSRSLFEEVTTIVLRISLV